MTPTLRAFLIIVGAAWCSGLSGCAVRRATSTFESDLGAALRTATWQQEEVASGVSWRAAQLSSLFDSPQSLCILQIDGPIKVGALRAVAPDPFARELTSRMASEHGAVAAVNGGFFDMRNGTPLDLLIQGGELRMQQGERHDAAFGIDAGGRVEIVRRAPGGWPGMTYARGAWPLLLAGGEVCKPNGFGKNDRRHPRTAMGIVANGSGEDIILVTIDGRTKQAAGMTLLELAQVMQALGCRDALNLDGGGSTTMWLQGRGVVNHPSDNGRFDHKGERKVSDAVLIFAPSTSASAPAEPAASSVRTREPRRQARAGAPVARAASIVRPRSGAAN